MTTTTKAPPASAAERAPAQAATGLPPHALLWTLATSAVVSRCLHVVAELGVADALEPDGADVQTLAEGLGLDVDALGRVLRALAAHGVFDVDLPRVRHSEASLLLRSDPAVQGSGPGTALLRHTLNRCDATGMAAYLEATSPRNRDLYRRHGFEVLASSTGPVEGRRGGRCGASRSRQPPQRSTDARTRPTTTDTCRRNLKGHDHEQDAEITGTQQGGRLGPGGGVPADGDDRRSGERGS